MQADVVLTVAESKRIIAKGVAAYVSVQRALQQGIVVVSTGTTTAYVVEEISGQLIDKAAYVTGRVMPTGLKVRGMFPDRLPDFVLRNGVQDPELDRYSAVEQFKPGDVFIKSANALNYERQVAGVAIGAGDGGTLGNALGSIIARRGELVIPVGLEKLVAHDIEDSYRRYTQVGDEPGDVCSLWPIVGTIVTEIEALRILVPSLEVFHVGSGGILGAEGGVRLLLCGATSDVQDALDLVRGVQGEPHFLPIPERE